MKSDFQKQVINWIIILIVLLLAIITKYLEI